MFLLDENKRVVLMPDDLLTDLGSKLAAHAITEVFNSCFNGLRKASEWAIEKGRERDFFGTAACKYQRAVEERYGTVKTFAMNRPVSLRKIFIKASVLERLTASRYETVEALEKSFDRDRRRFGVSRETKPALEIVNTVRKFILLGKPGAGKTTFLRYIALQAIDGALANDRIPIFVELRDLANTGISLLDFIIRQFDICQFPHAGPFIDRILKLGKAILLLDGLDEVAKAQEEGLINEIRGIVGKYSDNQFIISCRVAAYSYCFEQFADVEMADFSDEQIRKYIHNWFSDSSEVASSCFHRLQRDASIYELASVPLLLNLLCVAYEEIMDFPQNRAELYKIALDALLRKWDSSRYIRREEIYKNLSVGRKENLLSLIAARTFDDNQYFMSQRTLQRHIADYIEHLPDSKHETLDVDSEGILQAIEYQHGVFVARARGIYSFSHLTFQEYFTAKHIVENGTEGALQALVENHLTHERWKEVFLIIAGMLPKADDFLLLLRRGTNSLLGRGLAALLSMINLATLRAEVAPSSYYELAIIRAATLAETLRYLTHALKGVVGLFVANHPIDRITDKLLYPSAALPQIARLPQK